MGLIESLSVQPYCLITHAVLPEALKNNYTIRTLKKIYENTRKKNITEKKRRRTRRIK
jgi:hypothetical protein